jgi:hypothetical protein
MQQQPWQQQRWGMPTQQQHAPSIAGTQAAAGGMHGAADAAPGNSWQQQQQGQQQMQPTQPLEPQQLQQELAKVQQQLRAQATLAEQLRSQVRGE